MDERIGKEKVRGDVDPEATVNVLDIAASRFRQPNRGWHRDPSGASLAVRKEILTSWIHYGT